MMLRYSIVYMELTGMYKWKRFSGQHSKLYRSGSAIFSILSRVISTRNNGGCRKEDKETPFVLYLVSSYSIVQKSTFIEH